MSNRNAAVILRLGGLWGLRLANHLWKRVRREPEDGRYRQLRERWRGGQRKLFAMFQFQALLIALFANSSGCASARA